MFDKNKKYEVSKAHSDPARAELNSIFNQINPYNPYNAHVNFGFNRSNEDQEVNNFDKITEQDISDSLKAPTPIQIRSPSKRAKNLRYQPEEVNYERGESIFFERKSIVPQLETVIKWDKLELEVNAKGQMKKILDNVSGEVNNLEIMAILGPSGAGKSTLLNIIAGSIKDYKGNVNFYSKDKNIAFSYVPQVDQLTDYLTVKESLLFSSKLKNPSGTKHVEEVEFVLSAFNLWKTKNHYSYKCSGGERKRLSIGLEMISKPKILILDEPTSGLDSTTSYIVIEVLKNINKNTAIITTIHQPSSNLFQLFDKCYVLTSGRCIYNGTPATIVDHLKSKFEIICPTFTNPADFILEVANDIKTAEGLEIIERLSAYEQEKKDKRDAESDKRKRIDLNGNNQISIIMNNSNQQDNNKNGFRIFKDPINGRNVELQEIHRSSFNRNGRFFNEYYENTKKIFTCALRDPQQTIFRLMNNTAFPIILYLTITGDQSRESGCSFLAENDTHIYSENFYKRYDRQLKGTQGLALTFIDLMFVFFSSMIPAVLVLSQHINVLRKEYLNNYYTINSFFVSILSVNLLLGFVYSTANTFSYFFFTGQEYETKKFLFFWLIIFLNSILGDLFGLELSILYPDKILTAVVLGGFGGFALHTFSGFFVPINTMRIPVQTFSWFIFCRHIFEAAIRTFYGHGKCKIADHMIFSFDDLIDFVKYYNYQSDESLQDIEDMPLKVRNALREKTWNKTSIMEMAESMNDLDEEGMNKLNNFWNTKTSYILDSFSIENPEMTTNLIMIMCTITLLVTLSYATLRFTLRK